MKTTKKIILTGSVIFGCSAAYAQTEPDIKAGFEINGYFDFYYQISPQAHPAVPATAAGPAVLEGRSFDRHSNQMTLNMAELSLKKKTDKISFKADFAMGEMVDQLSGGGSQSVAGANTVNTAANEPTRNVTQAIVTYSVTDRLAVTAGKFYSHVGYEVTKAKDNWQYSRSYTYNYAIPFWHEGVNVSYAFLPKQFSGTVYLLNAWDGRISQEANRTATLGANLNFTGVEDLTVNYNYIGGLESSSKSQREVHEVNAAYVINPLFTVAVDYVRGEQKDVAALGNAKWSGLSFYLKAAINDFYTLSPRFELFDDSDNGFAISGGLAAGGVKQKITSWTLANNFTMADGLEARLELRSDKSDSDLYFKDKDGLATDHQESYTAALLYSF